MKSHQIMGVGFLLMVCLSCHAQLPSSSVVGNPPDLTKLSYKEADALVGSTVEKISSGQKMGQEYIDNVTGQIESGNLSVSNKVLAIWLLGNLRPHDTNSIECLLGNIDFKGWLDGRSIPRWDKYPVEMALWKVGPPALNPTLDHLAAETNILRRELLCRVLLLVGPGVDYSTHRQMAKDEINQRIAVETNPVKKANLEAALKAMDGDLIHDPK